MAVAEKEGKGDSFDLTQGVKLPDGYIVHKDEKTNELYVLDKTGKEQLRVPNALKDDVPSIIDFFTKLLGLTSPAATAETTQPAQATKPAVSDNAKAQDIITEIKELLNVEKGENAGQEGEPLKEKTEDEQKQDQELAALKKEIENKKGEVKEILNSLITDNKIIVSREDIRKHVIKGENAIFANKKAKEEKVQALSKKLWAMDSSTLKVLKDVFVSKTTKEIKGNNVSEFLMFLND